MRAPDDYASNPDTHPNRNFFSADDPADHVALITVAQRQAEQDRVDQQRESIQFHCGHCGDLLYEFAYTAAPGQRARHRNEEPAGQEDDIVRLFPTLWGTLEAGRRFAEDRGAAHLPDLRPGHRTLRVHRHRLPSIRCPAPQREHRSTFPSRRRLPEDVITMRENRIIAGNLIAGARAVPGNTEVAQRPAASDLQLHLSRIDAVRSFFVICAKDTVVSQLAGTGMLEFQLSNVRRHRLAPGDAVYVPAGTPHRYVPDGTTIQIKYKAVSPGLEAAAWYCTRCATELYRYTSTRPAPRWKPGTRRARLGSTPIPRRTRA